MSILSVSRRVLIASLLATPAAAHTVRRGKSGRPAARKITVTVAFDRQGHATPQWIGLIRDRIDANELAGVRLNARALSGDDELWIKLIRAGAPDWIKSIGGLDAPFRQGTPPAVISVIIGDGGGDDAFGVAPNGNAPFTIAFDLSALANAFGSSDPAARPAIVTRLLSREYTRLRLNAYLAGADWSPDWAAKSPTTEALRILYVQGLAGLRGIEGDPRWIGTDGTPTAEARKALAELQPIMVEKLKALWANPSPQAADTLLRDMTVGPLSQRWGVLPMALWLAADTNYDPGRIAAWIESNPDGLLQLATGQADRKYQRAFADLQAAVPDKVAALR